MFYDNPMEEEAFIVFYGEILLRAIQLMERVDVFFVKIEMLMYKLHGYDIYCERKIKRMEVYTPTLYSFFLFENCLLATCTKLLFSV